MKQIWIYNTLTRRVEQFSPIAAKEARIYTCGPTVYDYAHIGNMRSYIFSDLLTKVLSHAGYLVKHAMNITDVGHLVGDQDGGEDKLELGAEREGKHPLEIAQHYEAIFFDDVEALNIQKPSLIRRATETIPEQVELIQTLFDKGYAYQTESAIYFDTSKVVNYGKLAGQSLKDKQVGVRHDVVVDSDKRQASDFALWFFLVGRYKSHILKWDSPWGPGFPGWHVECSAISRLLLGQPFDIHAGGVDHIGTHHTNEIAQSEAAYDTPLAHYWMHGEFLVVEGKRMSKSEGNYTTLATLKEKGFSPLDFRYLCLTTHYRSRLNFTWEALAGAKKTRLALQAVVHDTKAGSLTEAEKQTIEQYLVHDLDTPKAVAALHQANNPALWRHFNSILGMLGEENLGEETVPDAVHELYEQRLKARSNHDWPEADRLRDELKTLGYEVSDTHNASTIKKVTTL